jgi:hypothetical protein
MTLIRKGGLYRRLMRMVADQERRTLPRMIADQEEIARIAEIERLEAYR